jgi:Tol biopolymer transport system component
VAVFALAWPGAPGRRAEAASSGLSGWVAYTREWYDAKRGQGYWGIAIADLAGNQQREITGRPSKNDVWEAFNPVWSPDGSRLAFVRVGLQSGLYVADRMGGGVRRVLQVHPRWDALVAPEYPSWSPDGRRLAYGDGPLFVVNPDGSDARRLVGAKTCNPVWSADGRSLVYLDDSVDGGCTPGDGLAGERGYRALYRINVDGTGRRLLAQGSIGSVAWSPDGSRIAYTNNCTVHHTGPGEWYCRLLMVMNADGSGKHTVPAGSDIDWVRWAAGGKALLWYAWDSGDLRTTTLSTGHVQRILKATPVYAAGIPTDGKTVVAFIDRPLPKLVVVAVSGRILQHVTIPSGWHFIGASAYLP